MKSHIFNLAQTMRVSSDNRDNDCWKNQRHTMSLEESSRRNRSRKLEKWSKGF